jgi:hypothetical protein
MKAKVFLSLFAAAAMAVVSSCATTGNGAAVTPPEVKVAVVNFMPTVEYGCTTEINYSVVNLTDHELTGLTLTVHLNPSNGLEVPYREMTIDRINPHGSWNPGPFVVRGRMPGSTAVFFIVSRDGEFLARDYSLVGVGPNDMMRGIW